MLIVLPDWYTEASKKLDKTILDITYKNNLPIIFVKDSKAIIDAKGVILDTLLRVDSSVDVDLRKELKEEEDKFKEGEIVK